MVVVMVLVMVVLMVKSGGVMIFIRTDSYGLIHQYI